MYALMTLTKGMCQSWTVAKFGDMSAVDSQLGGSQTLTGTCEQGPKKASRQDCQNMCIK